jgi:uncharacterized protein YcbX
MKVEQIWVYPVKSMIGGRVERAEVDERGIVGDRTWATRDEERGGIRGAKKIGELMQFAARYTAEPGGEVEITCPDGATLLTSQPDCDERLSKALDHRVTLWPLQPPDRLDHYRRGPADSDDVMEEMRSIFGREADEPLPDFSVFPPELVEFESPPGTYLDAFPIMFMSTSALRALDAALPGGAGGDVRRYRPSFVVDTGDLDGHPELSWKGRRLQLGTAELEILDPCPRCVMVTRRIDGGAPQDRAVLRHIVRDLDQVVGAYARIAVPGAFAVGDEVTLA